MAETDPYGETPPFRSVWRENHGNLLLAVAAAIVVIGGVSMSMRSPPTATTIHRVPPPLQDDVSLPTAQEGPVLSPELPEETAAPVAPRK